MGKSRKQPPGKPIHYVEERLNALGLTDKDVSSLVRHYAMGAYEMETLREEVIVRRITPGAFDQKYAITEGPDMVFHYVSLTRRLETYYRDPKSNRSSQFFRVRHANPNLHLDQYGKPKKYESPPGSGIKLWFPETLLRAYENAAKFDTLYLIEGELKAEMGAKHGMKIVGVGGIQNLAGKSKQLPKEFEMLIKQCAIKRVVFITDSDAFDLSHSLAENPNLDAAFRPNQFFNAVNNFREYFAEFGQVGIFLELFFAHLNPGPEKGLDDLLAGQLRGKEMLFEAECIKGLQAKVRKDADHRILPYKGEWVTMYNLTDTNKSILRTIWSLDDVKVFAKRYAEELKPLGKFLFRNTFWRIDDGGNVALAQPLTEEEQFWERNYKSGKLEFKFIGLLNFCATRNIGRHLLREGAYQFVRQEGKVVTKMQAWEVRDYVIDFTERVGLHEQREMLLRNKSLLAPESLASLKFLDLQFHNAGPDNQFFYFQNEFWEITAAGVRRHSPTELPHSVWRDQVRPHQVSLHSEPMVRFRDTDTGWAIDVSEQGMQCDLLKFLYLTSDFAWRERVANQDNPDWQYRLDDAIEYRMAVAAKLTAIGYLLHRYHKPTERRAVIGQDGRDSAVGISSGRSGKSLIGVILENMVPTLFIDGKQKKLEEDQFIFEEIEPHTGLVWIDDLRANFSLENFFAILTGKVTINRKGQGKFKLGPEQALKLYLCTNHTITGEGASHQDRQYLLAFSDYFNADHKPIDEFGRHFFTDWRPEDWVDFFNLMACCLVMYFQKGVIQAPSSRLDNRKYRQEVGEDLLEFLDTYFNDKAKLNQPIARSIVQADIETGVKQAKSWTSQAIRKKVVAYCKYKKIHLNPHKPDEAGNQFESQKRLDTTHIGTADKKNGVEYWTFGTDQWTPQKDLFTQ